MKNLKICIYYYEYPSFMTEIIKYFTNNKPFQMHRIWFLTPTWFLFFLRTTLYPRTYPPLRNAGVVHTHKYRGRDQDVLLEIKITRRVVVTRTDVARLPTRGAVVESE